MSFMKYIYFISQLHHVIQVDEWLAHRGDGVVLGWMRGHLALPPRPQLVLQVLLLVQLFLVEHDILDRGNCLASSPDDLPPPSTAESDHLKGFRRHLGDPRNDIWKSENPTLSKQF